MDLAKDFQENIEYVFNACFANIEKYPDSFKDLAAIYIKKLSQKNAEGKRSGGFCYLMPFWLKEYFGIEDNIVNTISVGNIFALLYFLSQDKVADDSKTNERGSLIALSNLFYLDFVGEYRKLFKSDSVFWTYFNKYIHEWANSVDWEIREHRGKVKKYEEQDFLLLSRKASPLKIPFAAVCLLGEKEELIDLLSKVMDYDQITYQMIDDWRDFKEDLSEGNFTYLLSEAIEFCNLDSLMSFNETHFYKAVYSGEVYRKIFNIAIKYNHMSKELLKDLELPYFKAYLDIEEGLCNDILKDIANEIECMQDGALNNLLRKLLK